EAEGTGQRIPATPSNERIVTVGVTVKAQEHDNTADLPPDEVVAWLVKDGNTIPRQLDFKQDHGPRLHARFMRLEPGTYEARAYRRVDGKTVEIATPKSVATVAGGEVRVDLFLYPAPQLKLVQASFVGDHSLLVTTPPAKPLFRDGKTISSYWGDGDDPKTKPFKPEYDATRAANNPPSTSTQWHPASYSRNKTIKLDIELEPVVPAGRSYTLEQVSLKPLSGAGGAAGSFTLEAALTRPLVTGTGATARLTAREPLPEHIAAHELLWDLRVVVSGAPMVVGSLLHHGTVYVTWGTPKGRVAIHESTKAAEAFPEKGPVQSVTEQRLAWAVDAADGATSEIQAVRKIFRSLKVGFFGGRRYPTPNSPGPNTTGIVPLPKLHHYLWFALVTPKTCECQDLAAALRMPARILGIDGSMKVTPLFPWPPWDKQGKRRIPGKKEPWQGSLRRYRRELPAACVFFDHHGGPNQYEAALRWVPPGDTRAILYAVGEGIYSRYLVDDHSGTMDDRNANLFFMPQQGDPNELVATGRFKLGMVEGGLLRRPAYGFLHPQQTLFQFHYRTDQFEAGDDRQVDKKGRLPK
ncbi:MAG: hypothetical protein DRI90_17095, partial [Deltaproteobacteria bacterium]